MHIASARTLPVLSQRRLAVSLAAALGCSLTPVWAQQAGPSDPSVMMDRLPYVHERARSATQASDRTPAHPTATTHFVDTCADDGSPNSLRSLIELSPNVHSGDTIDLTQLPMMCSKITLSNTFVDAPITVTQDTLYLHGPGADRLTIDANGYSSVFRHYGNGTLEIDDLTITNGYHKTAGPPQVLPRGGCIFSTGSVVLASSVVSHCETVTTSDNYTALGGAIYTQQDLRVYFSSLLESDATALSSSARGGAAYVTGDFKASYSTVSNNSANAPFQFGKGGGVWALASVAIVGSTISNNRAYDYGGITVGGGSVLGVTVTNSSITGNLVRGAFAGLSTTQPLTVVNSTVAFNRAQRSDYGGAGIYVFSSTLNMHSSIVAANLNGDGPADVGAIGNSNLDPSSGDNLVVTSLLPLPASTISDCPMLEPLANNGGPTLTHALNHVSPAIDHGNNDAILSSDQRQLARVIGAHADIGAVEWSPTDHDERIFLGGFDAKCEW